MSTIGWIGLAIGLIGGHNRGLAVGEHLGFTDNCRVCRHGRAGMGLERQSDRAWDDA